MTIGILIGTRPEIIKMSPILRLAQERNLEFTLIHTGQHYSFEMDRIFFKQLKLPAPKYHFDTKNMPYHKQLTKIIDKTTKCIKKENLKVLLVQGDTNSVLGGAIATKRTNIKLGHIEAGLRSYDLRMPEEHNRFITDHLSDFLFAPTKESAKILEKEKIEKKKIFLTGNTVVDAVLQNSKLAKKTKEKKPYFLLTLHRTENVDDKNTLSKIFDGLERIQTLNNSRIIFPIHPRTQKNIKKFGIKLPKNIITISPTGYLEFLSLLKDADLILTDSGGIQEESCVLKVPCITLRINTERPETIKTGSNVVAGIEPEGIILAVKEMMARKRNWKNPFGQGDSAAKILDVIEKSLFNFQD